jgi:mannosyl-glycoprotein endo-beta-N-acetylglucosaminidase
VFQMYAAKLVAIAWRGGFDGWLVNLENTIPSALIPNVETFLRVLRRGLQTNNPDAQVIWYGCLTSDGKRKHQVRLDESSVEFFRHVDGFFTDYGWTGDDAKFSAAFDLDRRYDVYMGIDVFGRHDTVGGGKLNCDAQLRLAWNSGVSAALFAPGWTYECYQHETGMPFVAAEVMPKLKWSSRALADASLCVTYVLVSGRVLAATPRELEISKPLF